MHACPTNCPFTVNWVDECVRTTNALIQRSHTAFPTIQSNQQMVPAESRRHWQNSLSALAFMAKMDRKISRHQGVNYQQNFTGRDVNNGSHSMQHISEYEFLRTDFNIIRLFDVSVATVNISREKRKKTKQGWKIDPCAAWRGNRWSSTEGGSLL